MGPDGVIMPMTGEFKVVDEPAKLVLTNSPLDADGKTTLDITSQVLSDGPYADQFLRGMEPGLSQAFDQLAMVLANS